MSASEEREAIRQADADEQQATSSPVLVTDLAHKTLAVKEGDVFLYSDREGNLEEGDNEGLGLYASDTRFLSRFRMRVSGRDPVLPEAAILDRDGCGRHPPRDLRERNGLAVARSGDRAEAAAVARVQERVRSCDPRAHAREVA